MKGALLMSFDETKDVVAGIIREECMNQGYNVKQLILFGSRASGEFTTDSDWDFVAILDRQIDWKQKMKIWLPINRRLGKLRVDADVLLKSEDDFESERNDTGKVLYYAYKNVIVA